MEGFEERKVRDWVRSRINSVLEMRIPVVKDDKGKPGESTGERENGPRWPWRKTGDELRQ